MDVASSRLRASVGVFVLVLMAMVSGRTSAQPSPKGGEERAVRVVPEEPHIRLTSIAKQDFEDEFGLLAFSPNGEFLAGGGLDFVAVLTVDELRTIHRNELNRKHTYSLLFTPDSKILFAGCEASAIWSLRMPNVELEMRESKAVWFQSMTPEGELCAATSHEIVLHDPKNGSERSLVSYDRDESVLVQDQFISPTGELVWLVRRRGAEETNWLNRSDPKSQRLQERKLALTTSKKDWSNGRVYPCSGKIIVCWSVERAESEERETVVEIWGGDDLRRINRCVIPNVMDFSDGVSLADGRFFCLVGLAESKLFQQPKGYLVIIETSTGKIVHRKEIDRRVKGVAFTPKGDLLATAQSWGQEGMQVQLWKVEVDEAKEKTDSTRGGSGEKK